jgi:hypothetical protein
MKLPGVGEVKDKNVMIGGGVVVGIVAYAYYKKRQASNTAAASTTNTGIDPNAVDPNAIDPSTGVPYGQEQGYGSNYYQGSIPNPYVSQTGTTTGSGTTTGQYANNQAWYADALTESTNYFGVSFATATSAFGKYLTQSRTGLNPDEFTAVSEVVALIGQPPTGGPFQLIQAAPVQTPPPPPPPIPTPTPTPTPVPQPQPVPVPQPTPDPHAGQHWVPPQVATLSPGWSLVHYNQEVYGGNPGTLSTLRSLNPGLDPNDTRHPGVTQIRTSNGGWRNN